MPWVMRDRVSSLGARQRLISRREAVALPCSWAGQKPPDDQAGAALGAPLGAITADVEEPEGVLGSLWSVSALLGLSQLAEPGISSPGGLCNRDTKHRMGASPHGCSLGHAPPSGDTSHSPRMTPCSSIPLWYPFGILPFCEPALSQESGGRNQCPLGCGAESHQYGGMQPSGPGAGRAGPHLSLSCPKGVVTAAPDLSDCYSLFF